MEIEIKITRYASTIQSHVIFKFYYFNMKKIYYCLLYNLLMYIHKSNNRFFKFNSQFLIKKNIFITEVGFL